MTLDIQRRMAFAKAFKQYPIILEAFVDAHVWLESPKDTKTPPARLKLNTGQKWFAMQVLMAQFCVRIVKTRARNGSPEMGWFAFEAAARYASFKQMLFKDLDLAGDPKYLVALQQVENNMATMIFEALSVEGSGPEDEFSEPDFWHDIFLSFAENQRRGHPLWMTPIQQVVLGYMPDFARALAAPAPMPDKVN